MERISRSWRLVKQSHAILMKDKELMVLPLLSMLAIGAVLATFVGGMFAAGVFEGSEVEDDNPILSIGGFIFYVVAYTIGIFFQAAVIAGASERMNGGDPTVGSAIAAASKRLPTILAWGLVAATVGMLIRAIQDRSEIVGKIVMGIVGVVWSLATYFMVPVIVMEEQGVGSSFKRSWAVFKVTWGETVVGNLGFGIVGVLLALPVVLVAGLLMAADLVVLAAVVGILGIVCVSAFLSALQGVWVASLFRYATAGEVPAGYDRDLVESAFRPKRGSRGL